MAESGEQWFYDVKTGSVTQGKQTGFQSRMGPYPTKEAAEHAIETARERTKRADEADRGW